MSENETEIVEETKKIKYEKIMCKYEFSSEELRETAETLAMKTQELREAEDEKKSVMSSYKERIDGIGIEISKAARLYKDKHDMRMIECVVEKDFSEGVVTYTRTDNGEITRTTKMTMNERQMHIDEAIKQDDSDDQSTDDQPTDEEIQSDIEVGKTNRLMSEEKASF